MTALTVQNVPAAGLTGVTYATATASDTAPTGAGHALLVRNTTAGALSFSVTTPGTVDGLAIADAGPHSVAATTGFAVVPLVGRLYGATATITDGTGLQYAVVKLAR